MSELKAGVKMEAKIAQNDYEFLTAIHRLVNHNINQNAANISTSVNNFITQKLISELNIFRKTISIKLIDSESSIDNFHPELYLKSKNGTYGLQFFLQMCVKDKLSREKISGKDINLTEFDEISNKLIFETFDTDYELTCFIKNDGYPLLNDIKEAMSFADSINWISFKYKAKIFFCRIIDDEFKYIECGASSLNDILNTIKTKIYELTHNSTKDTEKQFLSDLRNLYRELNIRENRKHASENSISCESNTEDEPENEKVMYFY